MIRKRVPFNFPNGGTKKNLPEMPEIAQGRVWWTWNMALAWIIWRSEKAVQIVKSSRAYAFMLGEALLEGKFAKLVPASDFKRDVKQEGESLDPVANAKLALIKRIQEGHIEAIGRPIIGRQTLSVIIIPALDFRGVDLTYGSGYREELRYDSGINNAASDIVGFAEPALRADEVKKAFPAGRKSQFNEQQIIDAIDFLSGYLGLHTTKRSRRWYADMLRAKGFKFSANAFKTRIWPAAVSQAGRDDLTKHGRRGNR